MSDDETLQLWLVDRTYDDKGLLVLEYATPDGTRSLKRERAAAAMQGMDVTAAIEVDRDRTEPVTEDDLLDRYGSEATRMRERHDPDDTV